MNIKNLNIGTRLAIAFAAVLGLTGAMTGAGIWELSRVADAKLEMKQTAHKQVLAGKWLENIATNSVRTLAKAKSEKAEDQAYFDAEMKAVSKRITDISKDLEPTIGSDEGKRLLSEIIARRKTYTEIRDRFFTLKTSGESNDAELKAQIDGKLLPAMNAYVASVQTLANYQQSLFDKANTRIDEVSAQASMLLASMGLAAFAIGAALAWALSRSITVPLGRAVRVAQTVAAGDLTSRIEPGSKDEVGQLLDALKSMNANLLQTVTEVRTSTDTIATASRQIAAGNLDLSSRTEEQAGSLEETASSMEELNATVRQNADSARQASAMAEAASGVAARGGVVIGQVVGTMGEINASSRQIADIIGVINGIAFQTNILALNAAVEAARAGEQGRGFAVVATEVRSLAQRSAAAAQDIKALIDSSVQRVEAGSRLVTEAGTTMQEIVDSVSRVTGIISEISAAGQEQTAGIDQINQAISQMDQVTQQNAALVEEAAAASESLQDQAVRLANVVGTFRIDGGAPLPAAAAAIAAPAPVAQPLRKPPAPVRAPAMAPLRRPATPAMVAAKPARRVVAAQDGGDWEEF
ncbi:methyl-accepting chemotaxis protein [Noviherbaspirillum suwonense]|jgi:methyl-accepting chemotaxis protein|uniref:Methyl-accepting chemotaxis protein/methyl-accepting chemotaxis protein-2, aspartate sensor receptor n=1 Tax=Noviherbaspirillum suwonense TaxID=1224511 RepID=A0ABY1Q8N8_9BURK|nr:methyl-accepting chemotaxis protein [Noviherbaspirillum suwonense]SMP63321.1 methyl-accepting chemotaxis protein/methyl-accepting chemotaxis protein-2, aspartate sensor receptor [Noviherbaspirillum suwonense]